MLLRAWSKGWVRSSYREVAQLGDARSVLVNCFEFCLLPVFAFGDGQGEASMIHDELL